MIIQPALDIPEHILEGLLSGKYVRYGGVVRDLAGHVVKHLDEVPIPIQNKESNLFRLVNVLRKHKVGVIIGIGVVIAAGGLALFVVDKSKKSKQSATPEIPKFVEDYNMALCSYLEAVRNGNLDIGTIDCLIATLNRVKENIDSGEINIDFSIEQLDALINLIFEYTTKLAEVNSIKLDELKKAAHVSANDSIIDLRRYLEIQKRIFEEAD